MTIQPISEVIANLKATKNAPQLVKNWRDGLPPGSRWQPNDLGDPNCMDCKGVGYVRLNLPTNHPLFGKLHLCDCCAGREQEKSMERLRKASCLEPEDFRLTIGGMSAYKHILPAIEAVRDTMRRGWGWCYLWGNPGNGKTRLVKSAIAEAIAAKTPAVYTLWPSMLAHIREGIAEGDMESRVDHWVSIGTLAIDEFGRAKESDWVAEVMARIMARRYESAIYKRGITLFGSNFAPEQSAPWMADRIQDGRFFCHEVKGGSLRPAQRA